MAKKHGARQQKKLAKHKAKHGQKRAILDRTSSKDPNPPTSRRGEMAGAQSTSSAELWSEGLGYLAIARQDAGGMLVFGVYLVDVLCLGVKDAFWRTGAEDFKELIERMNETQKLVPIPPAGLVKIVRGAVEFARLWLPAPPGLSTRRQAPRGHQSRGVPARAHIRPQRQALLYARSLRDSRASDGHRPASRGSRRTLYHRVATRCR